VMGDQIVFSDPNLLSERELEKGIWIATHEVPAGFGREPYEQPGRRPAFSGAVTVARPALTTAHQLPATARALGGLLGALLETKLAKKIVKLVHEKFESLQSMVASLRLVCNTSSESDNHDETFTWNRFLAAMELGFFAGFPKPACGRAAGECTLLGIDQASGAQVSDCLSYSLWSDKAAG
jgi:hypothetical protein